jgi:hypothetical protein
MKDVGALEHETKRASKAAPEGSSENVGNETRLRSGSKPGANSVGTDGD